MCLQDVKSSVFARREEQCVCKTWTWRAVCLPYVKSSVFVRVEEQVFSRGEE